MTFLIGSGLVACGSTPTAQPSLPPGPTPTVTVPIELPVIVGLAGRIRAAERIYLDEQIAAFEAQNPDIKVEIVKVRGGTSQRREEIERQLAEDEMGIDILVLDDTWLAGLASHGWLVPLDEYVKSQGIEMGDFLPSTVEASTINGQLLALPWAADGGLLYYRQDLLAKYGYQIPSTWAEVQHVALDIRDHEGLPSGFVWQGMAYESLTCNTLEFIWAAGGDVLDPDGKVVFAGPQTRAALQQMSELIASGASPEDVLEYSESGALTAFQNGEAVLMRNWSYGWEELNANGSPLRGQVGIAPLPASCLFGQLLALSTRSLHPEQAFRFMAFLAGYDGQVQLAQQLGLPPALETAYQDAALLAVRPYFTDLHTALLATVPRPRTPVYPQVSEAIYTEVNKMLTREQDVEITMANVQRRITAIVEEP